MNKQAGRVITITGGDCMGKNTQVKLLSRILGCLDINHKVMSFPDYNTPIGALMGCMLDNTDITINGSRNVSTSWPMKKGGPSVQYQLLAIANMFEKAQYMRELLNAGEIILCDRYDVDSLAYGLIDCGGDIEWIKQVQKFLPQSDCVVVLDGTGFTRGGAQDENERSTMFQVTVRKNYRTLAQQNDHWGLVDCNQYNNLDKRESIFMINKEVRRVIDTHIALFGNLSNSSMTRTIGWIIDDILVNEPQNKYLEI